MQRPDTRVPILLFVFGGSVSKDCVEFFPGALFIAHGEAYYVTGAVFSGCRKLSVDGAVELIGAGEWRQRPYDGVVLRPPRATSPARFSGGGGRTLHNDRA